MASTKSTTLIGEDTDLLILLLYHFNVSHCTELHFRSDKGNATVYNIKALKDSLGEAMCRRLLFLHAFTGCDSTSRIFGVGKKSAFQKILKDGHVICKIADVFCNPNQHHELIERSGSQAMLTLFGATPTDTLAMVRYNILCKKVARASSVIAPERLPPTSAASRLHSFRCYFQIMEWMGFNMNPLEWGWKEDNGKLYPIMTEMSPAPDVLLQMIHCNCMSNCGTQRCSCRKHGLECTSACGPCQIDRCDNTINSRSENAGDEDNDTLDNFLY